MRAKVNGTEIAYVERGKGKNTIVFVHGLGENKESWRYQTEYFSNKARTIAVDLRGHGESGDSNISLDTFVEDLRALTDKLGAKEIILCGLSMGGAISMAFCSKYPERVKAMILADTSSGFSKETAERMLSQRMDYIENKGMEELGRFISNGALSESADGALREEVRRMFASNRVEPYKAATRVAILSNLDEALPKIRAPVLIMVGEKDKTTPVELAKHLNERIKGSELRIIPGAGHLSKLEKPELFNSYMEEFLTKRGFL